MGRIINLNSLAFLLTLLACTDIVSLSGESGDFMLSPYLILVPLSFIVYIFKPRLIVKFFKNWLINHWLSIFITISAISAFFPINDPYGLSIKRWLLLLFFSISAMFIFSIVEKKITILWAMIVAVFLNFFIMVVEILSFYNLLDIPDALMRFVNLSVGIAGYLPRASGILSDPNRSAVFTSMVFILSLLYLKNNKIIFPLLFVVLSCLAFSSSRTGLAALILGYIVYATYYYKYTTKLYIASGILTLIIFILLTNKLDLTYFNEQLGTRQGSTESHLSLIVRGGEVFIDSVRSTLFGIGWGTEYFYTGIFDNNKYGNFHSGWLSVLIQTGIFGGAAYIFYSLGYIFKKIHLIPIFTMILWINIFYQFNADAWYWIVLVFINSISNEKSIKKESQSKQR